MSNVMVLIVRMGNRITECFVIDESQAFDAQRALWEIHEGSEISLYNCIIGKMPDNVRERVLEIQKRRSSVSVNKDAEIRAKDAEIQALKDKIDLIQAGCFFYEKTPQYWLALQATAQENGLDNLVKENERLKRERDLAIAHDTQPYPTAEAYEKVCAANEDKRNIIERLQSELATEREAYRRQILSLVSKKEEE